MKEKVEEVFPDEEDSDWLKEVKKEKERLEKLKKESSAKRG